MAQETQQTNESEARGREASELHELLCAAAEQLEEAAEDVESWGAYASVYFQEKHDLHGDVTKHKTYAALIRKAIGV